MTVTINLPEQVEQAYLDAAQAKGVSVDAFLSEVLRWLAPVYESVQEPESPGAELVEEQGVMVLRTGHPMPPSLIDDTIELIRRERDLAALGLI